MDTAVVLSLPQEISPALLWVIFTAVILAWGVASGILWFHWGAYGSQTKRITRMKRVYIIGSILLLLLSVSFIFSL